MNRRRFLETATGAALAGSVRASAPQGPSGGNTSREFVQPRTGVGPYERTKKGRTPHIFMISADMVSPDLYHPARPIAEHVHTPALHKLMADGTFFSNATCTVPLCAPSRASYLTGRYSYVQGNGERAPEGLETQLRPDDTIYPEYLRAAGYVCRQVGKGHVGTKKFLDAFTENDNPWDRWSPPVFDDDGFLAYQHSLGVQPQKYSREIVFKLQDRTSPGNSVGGWIVQENGKPYPLEAHYTYFQAKRLINTLRDLVSSGAAKKRPLYLQLDIFDPHQPFSIPAGFEAREEQLRKIMTLPQSYDDARARDFKRADDDAEIIDIYRKYWGIYDPQTLLDYRVAYALQMEIVDHAIGMVLDEIRALGLYDESVIAFISDHGEMNGRRALVDKGVYLYPDVLRVPFIVKGAGPVHGRVVDEPVSLLDLSQTLLDVAGIRPEAKFDGISLLPALEGRPLRVRSPLLHFGGWHVGVNFNCGIEHRMPDGRYFLYGYNLSSPCDELYDMNSNDAVNLINDPAYREVRDAMIRLLGDELQRDPRWVGYWAEFRIARYALLPKTNGDMQLFTKPT